MSKLVQNPVIKYFLESRDELKKVTWPSQRETIRYSVIVIAITLALAVYFGLADWIIGMGLDALLSLS